MELRSHIIHLRIIYIFFCNGLCAGAALLCQQEKNYIRGGGWRLVGCGFFGVLQIGSAMQQSFSARSLARWYICVAGVLLIHVFQWCCCECVPSCCWWCGTDNTRASRKKAPTTEKGQTPRKMGKKSRTPPALGHHLLYQKRLNSIGWMENTRVCI